MNERRLSRSANPPDAVALYLESLCARAELKAVALSTDDGSLVAGAGGLDLEWMGALGAASRRAQLEWDGHTLRVDRIEVNSIPFWLTMADGSAAEAPATIRRILSQ